MTLEIEFREATLDDVDAMQSCRRGDPAAEPADRRMAAYFAGQHHPQQALPPRTGYVALANGEVIGYIAGHLTTRHGCEGEVQYLYVAPPHRRRRIGSTLLQHLAQWFQTHHARKICVALADDSPAEARPFYEHAGASPLRKYWYGWEDIGN
jgi:GNAT superfamily N-acetyltransferase